MKMKCSGGRLVVLKELIENGPTAWGILARIYYGEKRFTQNSARTSFMNQLNKVMGLGYVHKNEEKLYSITDIGRAYLMDFDSVTLDNAMSEAQVMWEANNG